MAPRVHHDEVNEIFVDQFVDHFEGLLGVVGALD